MTKNEIIDMARQAGFRVGPSRDGPDDVRGAGLNLEWFAKLVAAKEREACAKLCDDVGMFHKVSQGADLCFELGKSIRARDET